MFFVCFGSFFGSCVVNLWAYFGAYIHVFRLVGHLPASYTCFFGVPFFGAERVCAQDKATSKGPLVRRTREHSICFASVFTRNYACNTSHRRVRACTRTLERTIAALRCTCAIRVALMWLSLCVVGGVRWFGQSEFANTRIFVRAVLTRRNDLRTIYNKSYVCGNNVYGWMSGVEPVVFA